MSKAFSTGGVIASIILIVAGIGTIVVAASGQSEVRDKIEQEQIVGTPDMNPDDTRAAVEEAGLTDVVDIPDCDVADKPIDDGDSGQVLRRVHARARPRGHGRQDLRRDAALRDRGRQGHERARGGAEGPEAASR